MKRNFKYTLFEIICAWLICGLLIATGIIKVNNLGMVIGASMFPLAMVVGEIIKKKRS